MIKSELKNVSKSFQDKAVLRGLSLEIHEHELLALIGPSGCGKSTTLRLLAGLETVDAGSICFMGKDVTRVPPFKRDVSIVFQSGGFYDDMTVEKNLRSAVERVKPDRKQIDTRLNNVAGLLGLEGQLDHRPNQLSGGQLQRLVLGRGLMRQAGLMLLDEPLNHLDTTLRIQLRQELMSIQCATGQTMVYVTHDPQEAMMLGDRIAVMHDGRVQQVDRPTVIYNYPNHRSVASLLDANMRFYAGLLSITKDQIEIELLDQRISWTNVSDRHRFGFAEYVGQIKVDIGIRAEDWTLRQALNGNELCDKSGKSVQAKVAWRTRWYMGSYWNFQGLAEDGQEIVAVFPSAFPLPDPKSESCILEIARERLHLFEADSGKRIEFQA